MSSVRTMVPGIPEGGGRVALQQREIEDREDGRLGEEEPRLVELPVPVADVPLGILVHLLDPHRLQDFREVLLQGRTQAEGAVGVGRRSIFGSRRDDPDDAVGRGVEPIVGPLVPDPEEDEQGAGQPEGQPADVDQGEGLLAPEAAEGDPEVAPQEARIEARWPPGKPAAGPGGPGMAVGLVEARGFFEFPFRRPEGFLRPEPLPAEVIDLVPQVALQLGQVAFLDRRASPHLPSPFRDRLFQVKHRRFSFRIRNAAGLSLSGQRRPERDEGRVDGQPAAFFELQLLLALLGQLVVLPQRPLVR